jgi:hypothetical protein
MRRIRISTWVLAAIFVAALVVHILIKPSSTSNQCPAQHSSQHAQPATPAPTIPGVAAGSPDPSPADSTSCS